MDLLRRRLQPGSERAADAQARAAGQGVRGRRLAWHRGEPRDPALPQRRQGSDLFPSSGAETFARDWKKYPYTTAWFPDYVSEGLIYGGHIRQNHADAKIGVIYQNDDYGKNLLYGLKVGLGKSKGNIVSEQAFEVTTPSPSSQIARLRASGARSS